MSEIRDIWRGRLDDLVAEVLDLSDETINRVLDEIFAHAVPSV